MTKSFGWFKVKLPTGKWTPPILAEKAKDAKYYIRDNYFRKHMADGKKYVDPDILKVKRVGSATVQDVLRFFNTKIIKRVGGKGYKWTPIVKPNLKRGRKPKVK